MVESCRTFAQRRQFQRRKQRAETSRDNTDGNGGEHNHAQHRNRLTLSLIVPVVRRGPVGVGVCDSAPVEVMGMHKESGFAIVSCEQSHQQGYHYSVEPLSHFCCKDTQNSNHYQYLPTP